jgi:putative methyltransferase (TIGR04325 family)
MNRFMRTRILAHTPPEMRQYVRRRFGVKPIFDDSHNDWASASLASSGYDSIEIARRVLVSTLAVQAGHASFERDSIAFPTPENEWPVLGSLLWAAAADMGNLNVLDFGGALGSTYFQYKSFFGVLKTVCWNVVEQPVFVDLGRREIHEPGLTFHESMQEVLEAGDPTVIHFGSSLQYVEDPFTLLDEARRSPARFLIVDRVPVCDLTVDSVAVQVVPADIYSASYPVHIFSRKGFQESLERDWEVVDTFESLGGKAATTGGVSVSWQGWLLSRAGKAGRA